MKRSLQLRSRLFAPLIHLAALVLLLEEWFWDLGMRLAAHLAGWPPLRWLEERVRSLPPYVALCVFVLPGLLLFPVKVLAVVAIAHGHPATGIATILVAKIGGAAVVARLYVLTLPTLLALGWFARLHARFMALLERLRASRAFRHSRHLVRRSRRAVRRWLRRLSPSIPWGSRHASTTSRILRRLAAIWRARRRQASESDRP